LHSESGTEVPNAPGMRLGFQRRHLDMGDRQDPTCEYFAVPGSMMRMQPGAAGHSLVLVVREHQRGTLFAEAAASDKGKKSEGNR
jgi:hypothetical protein